MVKGAARAGGASGAPAAATTSQPLPQMQTGQNVHDPLSQLNSHLAFGQNLSGFNPFKDMGVNQNDPNMVHLYLILFVYLNFRERCQVLIR